MPFEKGNTLGCRGRKLDVLTESDFSLRYSSFSEDFPNWAKRFNEDAGKSRYWTGILYPDSADLEGFIAFVREFHIPFMISPLHDRDMKDDGSGYKKPHYHFVVFGSGPMTYQAFCSMVQPAGGVTHPFFSRVRVKYKMVRYLIHADDPDKAQYNSGDVLCIGGIDFWTEADDDSDKYVLLAEMIRFIDENGVFSYAEFDRYCLDNNMEWFRALHRNCREDIFKHIQSLTYRFENPERLNRVRENFKVFHDL